MLRGDEIFVLEYPAFARLCNLIFPEHDTVAKAVECAGFIEVWVGIKGKCLRVDSLAGAKGLNRICLSGKCGVNSYNCGESADVFAVIEGELLKAVACALCRTI